MATVVVVSRFFKAGMSSLMDTILRAMRVSSLIQARTPGHGRMANVEQASVLAHWHCLALERCCLGEVS
jgi:hypothetical protein